MSQLDEITRRALSTWYEYAHPLHFDKRPAVMGLVGEAGEVNELIKKHHYKPGYTLPLAQLIEELGDVLYYLTILAYQTGVTLEELSDLNYKKLTEREENNKGYNRGESQGR
jgi:NTP pyrophosphatase (non-canonical NTP hydrolase)